MLCAAFNSAALTLGRMRGAAIVGQPLEVAIPVQLDSEENASALCVEADVFHADARQDASRVRVSVEALPQPQAASVRIFSLSPVDEPIVTVYLKAGCGQKSTRRYVLLADIPSATAAPGPSAAALANGSIAAPIVAPMAAPVAAVPIALAGVPAAPPAGAPAPLVARGETAAPMGLRRETRKAPAVKTPVKNPEKAAAQAGGKTVDKATGNAPAPTRAGVAEKPKAALPPPQPRLKLDSLVMLAERVASLESSPAAPVEQVQRDSQKLQSLEADMKALVALAARNEANLMALQTRIQQAEAERLPAQWFYGLLALMAACLAAMAYFWRRPKARVAAVAPAIANDGWWSGSRAGALAPAQPARQLREASGPAPLAADLHEAAAARTAAHAGSPASGPSLLSPSLPQPLPRPASQSLSHSASQPLGRGSGHPGLRDEPESQVDVSLVEMSESNFDKLMASGQAQSALRRGPLPPPAEISRPQALQVEPARSINSEEIFDIRQQAEFFVSLGQTDQAVRILENRIIDDGESSPLIYLDLLAILHTVGLKSDYRQFREDFNLLFNSKVPEFAAFREEGKTLEAYPHVLAHITALWPKPKVLMVIEASIFRDPWDDKSPPFDLAAFRDLLLLHAIAQGIVSQDSAVSRPGGLRAAGGAPVASGSGGAHGSGLQTRAGFSQVSAPAALAFDGEEVAAPQSVSLDLDLTQADGPSLRLRSMPNRGIDFPSTMPGIGPAAGPVPGPAATPLPGHGNGLLPGHSLGHSLDHSPSNLPELSAADDNFINLDLPLQDDVLPAARPKH